MRGLPTFALKSIFFIVIADLPTEHLVPQNNVMLTESQDLTYGLTGPYSKILIDIIFSQEKNTSRKGDSEGPEERRD